jgi:predicted sulfurtransferase
MDKIQYLPTTSNFQEINGIFLTMYHATQIPLLYQQDVTHNLRRNILCKVLVSIEGLNMSNSNTTTSIARLRHLIAKREHTRMHMKSQHVYF